jgi:hypothetical protein
MTCATKETQEGKQKHKIEGAAFLHRIQPACGLLRTCIDN